MSSLLTNRFYEIHYDVATINPQKAVLEGVKLLKEELNSGENKLFKLFCDEGTFSMDGIHEYFEVEFIALGEFFVQGVDKDTLNNFLLEHSELRGSIKVNLTNEMGQIKLNESLLKCKNTFII